MRILKGRKSVRTVLILVRKLYERLQNWGSKLSIVLCLIAVLLFSFELSTLSKTESKTTSTIKSEGNDSKTIAYGNGSQQDNQEESQTNKLTISACKTCHEDEIKSYQRTTHSKSWELKDEVNACINCHGNNLAEHANDPTTTLPKEMKTLSTVEFNQVCLKCHEKSDDRSKASLSEHTMAGVSCVECHNVHPTEAQNAKMLAGGQNGMFRGKSTELCLSCHKNVEVQFSQTSHHRLKEGVMECTSCHNPHGSSEVKLLKADRKEVCVQCHQDKRGPFMFEHGAMLDERGCVTCHEQHGSGSLHMLKARDPKTLCMGCHAKEAIGMHGVSGIQYNNGVPFSGLTSAGDCTRCHAEIHGSNSSAYLHR